MNNDEKVGRGHTLTHTIFVAYIDKHIYMDSLRLCGATCYTMRGKIWRSIGVFGVWWRIIVVPDLNGDCNRMESVCEWKVWYAWVFDVFNFCVGMVLSAFFFEFGVLLESMLYICVRAIPRMMVIAAACSFSYVCIIFYVENRWHFHLQ